MSERRIRAIIGNRAPVAAASTLTVTEAAKLMQHEGVGALLVTNAGHLAGIFTERDALFRVIAEGRDPKKTPLAEVMTANPRTIALDRPFDHALHLMYEGGFRHVPVLDDGRPVGVVSVRDALGPELQQFAAELDEREHIGEVMR